MHVPTPERIATLDAVEDILFLGYPYGIYDEMNKTPIARKGITATSLQRDYGGESAFLIDATAFPRSSGSPVIGAPNTIRPNENRNVKVVGSQLILLGILSHDFVTTEKGKIEIGPIEPGQTEPGPTPDSPDMSVKVRQSIDLGYVYKSSTLVETIEDFEEKYVE